MISQDCDAQFAGVATGSATARLAAPRMKERTRKPIVKNEVQWIEVEEARKKRY
jgi:gas vesicle protein